MATSHRLLQVTTIPGTLEAFILPFARHFKALGWSVEAAANGVSGNVACLSTFDAVHDVDWSRNPLSPKNMAAAREIARVVKDGEFDIVHVHTPVASFVTRLALRRSKPAVVYTAHGFHFHGSGDPLTNVVFQALEKAAAPRTDWLVVLNSEDEAAAKRLHLAPAGRLTFLPGIGVDIEGFLRRSEEGADRSATRRALSVPEDAPVALMVAEFTPNKRHADAVRSIARLRSEGMGIHLVVAGEGDLRAATERLAADMGLADAVHLLGFRNDVPALLKAADVLLLLSEREGLPRSVMEAMAVGVPVVGTRIRGITDLLSDGAGYLVPVGDVVAIADAVREATSARGAVEGVVARARQKVEQGALPTILTAYERIYDALLADPRGR